MYQSDIINALSGQLSRGVMAGGIQASKHTEVTHSYRRLNMPAVLGNSLTSTPRTDAVISVVARKFRSDVSCFGIEQAVQFLIEERYTDRITRKPFYRLAPEAALLGYWNSIGTMEFLDRHLIDFLSVTLSRQAEVRTGEVCAHGDGDNRVLFEPADFNRWIGHMEQIYALKLAPVQEAIAVYAQTVFSHPFRDGNGRLSRALIYGSLRRGGLISTPCLGLGPTFDYSRRPLSLATLALSERGDWKLYSRTLDRILRLCAINGNLVFRARYG